MIVISDTTPIISLIKADKLELLQKLFHVVMVPKAVYEELTENEEFSKEADLVKDCSYLVSVNVENLASVNILRNVTGLDAGESEALVLYGEQNADLLLIDENKGRRVAKQMEVKHIGTVGILIMACDKGILKPEEVAESLDVMLKSEIRLSRSLCNKVLERIGFKTKY